MEIDMQECQTMLVFKIPNSNDLVTPCSVPITARLLGKFRSIGLFRFCCSNVITYFKKTIV